MAFTFLLRPAAGKHNVHRLKQDLNIAPQGPVIDILDVQLDDFFKILDVAAAADLPQAGDAGFHGQAALVVALVLLIFVQRRRAGANQAHIAAQHVKELRQLVDAGLADELAHLGDAGVVLHFKHQAVHFVLGHQALFAFLGIHIHAAQLVDVEHTAV